MASNAKHMGKKKPVLGVTKTPSGKKPVYKGMKHVGKKKPAIGAASSKTSSCKKPAIGANPLKTLIHVLGFLAAMAMAGHIGIAIASGSHSTESLVGLCSAIIGYLGGILTPRS